MALAAGLLSVGALVTGAGPAVAAPDGPPARFYLQNVSSGYHVSAADSLVEARRPKGDEDQQQWEFVPQNDGSHQIRSTTRTDTCLARSHTGTRAILAPCGTSTTPWWLQQIAGEKYSIHAAPGSAERLTGGTVHGDDPVPVTVGSATDRTTHWYTTPVRPVTTPLSPEDREDPTFDQLTFLTAHNAFQNTEDIGGAAAPNQPHSMMTQLNDGVRGLMIDVHQYQGRPSVCHDNCFVQGWISLEYVLEQLGGWLRTAGNEREIVTLFIQDEVTTAQLQSVFDLPHIKSGLGSLVFNPRTEKVDEHGWPRRSEMINENKRLVIFSDKGDDKPTREGFGVMFAQDWTVENYWSMGAGLGNSDWRCYSRWTGIPLTQEEGKFRRLFVMNHFRDIPMSPTYRNDNAKLQDRAERFCMPAARKKPNYLAVDQYKDGNPMAAVDALNTYSYSGDTPGDGGTAPTWRVPRLAVMPLGDSITQGVGSSTGNGYRAELRNHLQNRATTLDFVGSLQHGTTTDPEHEGHSGFLIEGIAANVESWLYQAKPNVVTLHLGSNDINRDHQSATAPARLGALMDQILAAAPDVTLLVASLVPNTRPGAQARVDAFNAQVPGLVQERRNKGFKVAHVNFSTVKGGDLPDGLHPNNSGYRKMARAFFNGLTQAATAGWITENVVVRPVPPGQGGTGIGDQDVDLNNDGRADYLVVGANGSVRAFLNRGGDGRGGWEDLGHIAAGSAQWTAAQIRFADLDADGAVDYLVVGANGSVRALLNRGGDGRGGWEDLGTVASGSAQWTGAQVRFADLNADRRADYLVVGANGSVRALLNRGGDGRGGWEDLGPIAAGSAQWTGGQVRM
ncbi:GDSL-type esterase/lipase family protein [Streptomyces sp. NPDC088789]|uniref:GDSL-type esterase/lipase family protein n=1 Tax=Streptomyces sp. NPDC088789 TaxID=3365899 RepID=UPI0037F7C9A4